MSGITSDLSLSTFLPDDDGAQDEFVEVRTDAKTEAFAGLLRSLRSAIAEVMLRERVTKAELARRLNVSGSVISRIMNPDADVLVSTLFDIAWVLHQKWEVVLNPVRSGPSQGIEIWTYEDSLPHTGTTSHLYDGPEWEIDGSSAENELETAG